MFDKEPLSILVQMNKKVICKEYREVLRTYESCIENIEELVH